MQDLINSLFLVSLIILSGAVAEALARKKFWDVEKIEALFFFIFAFFLSLSVLVITHYDGRIFFAVFLILLSLYFLQESKSILLATKKVRLQYFFFELAFLSSILIFTDQFFFISYSLLVFSVVLLFLRFVKLQKGKTIFVTSEGKALNELLFLFGGIFFALLFLERFKNISLWELNANFSSHYLLAASFVVALLVAIFYAISSNGGEYLTVPLSLNALIYVFFSAQDYSLLMNFSIGLLLAFAVTYLSYKVKFLTLSGSVATFLLAGFIFGLGGWKWSVPILTFFILSSLLSKVRKKKNDNVELYFEKTGVRDHWQVIANGGLGGVLILLNQIHPNEIFYFAYLASLAAVCADTWATEIGTMFPAKTVNILTFKEIEQGISGGVSWRGTFGAFLGALVVAVSGMFWVNASFYYFAVIVLAGLLGSVFDSILGATLQLQNQCVVCNKITERNVHCSQETKYFRGLKWLNNDIVNLFAGLFGIFIIITFYSF